MTHPHKAPHAEPIFDENLVCPLTGEGLFLHGSELATPLGSRYAVENGISMLYADEPAAPSQNHQAEVTHTVRDFYVESPFPNYNSFDNVGSFVRQAEAGMFTGLLRDQIPLNANILEVGCGTGQLSNFLAATTLSRVYGADLSPASLRLGADFARQNDIEGVRFLQMNLFMPAIRAQSMDVVIANGVLHHTYDTKKAFMSISRLVKPGGHIIIGLYNHIGRLRTDFRRWLVQNMGEGVLFLDPHLRKNLSAEKRHAWIRDQYYHPQERKHSISELVGWFGEAGFSFVSSLPKIIDPLDESGQLFQPQDPGGPLDRWMAEVGMLFSSYGGEGGLFIGIGKKSS